MANFRMEEAEAILDLVEFCNVVKIEQIPKIFPNSNCEKILNFLLKRQRIHISEDKTYIHSTQIGRGDVPRPDKALIAALGVLGDIIGKVQTYTKSIPPAQLSFLSHSGDFFEICYVKYGMEAMTVSMFNSHNTGNSQKKASVTKRIVIIEDATQIDELKGKIPGIARFAIVLADGGFKYVTP